MVLATSGNLFVFNFLLPLGWPGIGWPGGALNVVLQ